MTTTTSNNPATLPSALEVLTEPTPTPGSIYEQEKAGRNHLQKVSQDLQPISRNDWVPSCGKKFKNPSFRKFSDGKVSKPRQLRCHNLLRCPECAARATAPQAKALANALNALPGRLVFLTVTVAHTPTTPVYEQLERFTAMWSNLTRGRAYAALRRNYGHAGSYRTIEATWSEQEGFHVHHHLLLILDQDANVDEFRDDWLALWCGTAKKLGYYASRSAQDVQSVERSDARVRAQYLTKQRYPKNALELAAQGNVAAARAWTEWCAAVADLRTRSTQPSGELRKWNERRPAPEVIEEVQLTTEVATVLQALNPELVDAALETLRVQGAVAAVELLRRHGYPSRAVARHRTVWRRLRDLVLKISRSELAHRRRAS